MKKKNQNIFDSRNQQESNLYLNTQQSDGVLWKVCPFRSCRQNWGRGTVVWVVVMVTQDAGVVIGRGPEAEFALRAVDCAGGLHLQVKCVRPAALSNRHPNSRSHGRGLSDDKRWTISSEVRPPAAVSLKTNICSFPTEPKDVLSVQKESDAAAPKL